AAYPDASTASWGYDNAGNRTSETKGGVTTASTYDNANRLTAQGTTTFTYDNNGNRLTKSPGGKALSYTYDAENRLKSASGPTAGRFLTQDTNTGVPADPASLQLFNYGHDNPLRYTDPSGHWPWPIIPISPIDWGLFIRETKDLVSEAVGGAVAAACWAYDQ